ncbi:plasmid mobilization protein [Varunaivibrio sulfuroxidans]|uniref:Mobilization protein MobC n=1 Tax=Varunaivibrio sulfuroxidans TaxID=1773489 RepID=A0A4R3J9D3_9PROT|nr:plasmid mobilization relaxosome protein MobC [Varunaivibrio sulfuroxidans]TCS61596.1 mobilization protein MobC [Varunaivibrio sulfuroxidans]WES29529.1 plasmid mobilization relaxosome protein MobC [Varunaivibrio sulfuroxidans]
MPDIDDRTQKEKRTLVLSVRVSKSELEKLKELAAQAGIKSVSTYTRRRGLSQILASSDRATIRQLTLIGNNLNQIVRRAHQDGLTHLEDEVYRLVFDTLAPAIRRVGHDH